MTATALDVNQQFTAERAAQARSVFASEGDFRRALADGMLRNLGNGRYQVTRGIDRGEIFQLNDQGMLVAQHGLDTTTGRVAFYGRVPAWHALGNIVAEGLSDIDEAMTAGGTAYLVGKRPATFQVDPDGPLIEIPGRFVTYREDTGAPLGIVGRRYEIFQNRVGFEFLEELVDKHGATWESVGALRGGAKVFCCMRLPLDVRIDVEGVNDEIRPYVIATNTHDGTSPLMGMVSPWRPECGNTERFAVRDALTKWTMRHVGDPLSKAAEARRTMRLAVDYYEQFAREEQALAESDMALAEFEQLLGDLWKVPDQDAPAVAQTRWQNRRDTLMELHENNTTRLGHTAYAAERTITEFADWKSEVRPGGRLRGATEGVVRATAVIEGTRDALKSRAHRRLLERAGR